MIEEYLKKRREDIESSDFIIDWSTEDEYEAHMSFKDCAVLRGRTDELDIIEMEEPTIDRYEGMFDDAVDGTTYVDRMRGRGHADELKRYLLMVGVDENRLNSIESKVRTQSGAKQWFERTGLKLPH